MTVNIDTNEKSDEKKARQHLPIELYDDYM